MAVKNWVVDHRHGGWVIATVVLDPDDTSNALELPNYPQKNIQVVDQVGIIIAEVEIQGSNEDGDPNGVTENVKYKTLHQAHDPSSLTFDGISTPITADVLENTRFIKVLESDFSMASTLTIVVLAYTSR